MFKYRNINANRIDVIESIMKKETADEASGRTLLKNVFMAVRWESIAAPRLCSSLQQR